MEPPYPSSWIQLSLVPLFADFCSLVNITGGPPAPLVRTGSKEALGEAERTQQCGARGPARSSAWKSKQAGDMCDKTRRGLEQLRWLLQVSFLESPGMPWRLRGLF